MSHLNYQVLNKKNNLKHSTREQYLKDQQPVIVLKKTACVFIYMYNFFLGDRKWCIQVMYQREMQK